MIDFICGSPFPFFFLFHSKMGRKREKGEEKFKMHIKKTQVFSLRVILKLNF